MLVSSNLKSISATGLCGQATIRTLLEERGHEGCCCCCCFAAARRWENRSQPEERRRKKGTGGGRGTEENENVTSARDLVRVLVCVSGGVFGLVSSLGLTKLLYSHTKASLLEFQFQLKYKLKLELLTLDRKSVV